MSIDSYFKRTTKVIDDKSTPECSPHSSESSGLTTTIPAMQVTPLQRAASKEQTQEPDNSLLSWSWTLPLGLVDVEEKEEKENSAPKVLGAPRKEHPSQEMELTLLLTPTRLSQPDPWLTLMMTVFLWTLLELCMAKQKSAMRKRCWAAPAAKKRQVSNPYRPGCCGTLLFSSLWHQYPKGLPQGTTLLIKEWLQRTSKKKDSREEFWMYDLVDVNGGLWYGAPIFTFWWDQVDKGVMPEPDMEYNYIRLYKTHKDTFQIMLTPKPKRPAPKKKSQ